jgi:transposase
MAVPRKYPIELQQRAVRPWKDANPRRPIVHVARELGVHPKALRNWIRQDEADRGQPDDRLTSQQLEELQRLRRRVVQLERANEILKAASAVSPGTPPDPATVMRLVQAQRDRLGVEPILRVLQIPLIPHNRSYVNQSPISRPGDPPSVPAQRRGIH